MSEPTATTDDTADLPTDATATDLDPVSTAASAPAAPGGLPTAPSKPVKPNPYYAPMRDGGTAQ